MIKTGLEFAPGTTEDCKRLAARLFEPGELLGAYRAARRKFRSGDIVLVTAEYDPSGFTAMLRLDYVKKIRRGMGVKAAAMLRALTIAHQTAHKVVQLPFESDAFWLVISRREAVPVMAILFAMPYETGADVSEPAALVSLN